MENVLHPTLLIGYLAGECSIAFVCDRVMVNDTQIFHARNTAFVMITLKVGLVSPKIGTAESLFRSNLMHILNH